MKKYLFFLFLISFVLIFLKKEKINELLDIIFKKNGLYLISILDKEEYIDARIKGSVFCDIDNVDEFLKNIDKSNILVFYCANYLCTSSEEIAIYAFEKGFKKIYVYKDGISDWIQKSKKNKEYKYDGLAEFKYLEIISSKKEKYLIKNENNKYFKIISAEDLQNLIKSNKLFI